MTDLGASPPLAPSLGGGPPRLGDPGQARDTVERGGRPAGVAVSGHVMLEQVLWSGLFVL